MLKCALIYLSFFTNKTQRVVLDVFILIVCGILFARIDI